jgi:hypothetical protein
MHDCKIWPQPQYAVSLSVRTKCMIARPDPLPARGILTIGPYWRSRQHECLPALQRRPVPSALAQAVPGASSQRPVPGMRLPGGRGCTSRLPGDVTDLAFGHRSSTGPATRSSDAGVPVGLVLECYFHALCDLGSVATRRTDDPIHGRVRSRAAQQRGAGRAHEVAATSPVRFRAAPSTASRRTVAPPVALWSDSPIYWYRRPVSNSMAPAYRQVNERRRRFQPNQEHPATANGRRNRAGATLRCFQFESGHSRAV